jgi:hypothetical protein
MSIDIISAAGLRLIALDGVAEINQPLRAAAARLAVRPPRQFPAPATGRTAPLDLRRPLRYAKRNHSTLGCWMVKKRSFSVMHNGRARHRAAD